MERSVKTTFQGILIGTFLVSIDQSVVGTVLPVIVQDLGDTWLYAWVAVAYTLGSAVALPVAGRLADIRSPNKLYCWALSLFCVTSLLCGMAQSMPELVAMRAVQGIGGGGMLAVGNALLGHMFPPAERAKYFGLVGATVGLAGLIAPLLGGLLADYLSWRLVFYINIPLVLYILHIFLFRNTIEPEITSEPFDLAGAITLALSTSGFMLSLAIAGHTMEWTSPLVIGSAALGVVSLAVFVRIERTSSYPLLNLNLLRNKPLTWSCLAQWGNAGVLMSAILFLPLYLIHVRGFSATGAGLTLLSTTLCAIASAVTLQKLMGKFGYKRLITLGSFGSVVLLTVAWWGFDQHTPLHTIVLFLCGLGFCFGMIMPVFSLVAQSAVEKKSLGTASSLVQFARELGFTTSTAILGTLMVLTLHSTLPQLMPADLAKGLGVVEFKDQQDLENQLSDRLNKLTKLADDDSEASREKLLSDPLVPGSLKEQIRGKQDVTDALHKLEIHYQEEIDRVLNTTLTRATAVTFVGGAFFALFCFLCCLRIPEIELKKE